MIPGLTHLEIDGKRNGDEADLSEAQTSFSRSEVSKQYGQVIFDAFGTHGAVLNVSQKDLIQTSDRYEKKAQAKVKRGAFNVVVIMPSSTDPPDWCVHSNYSISLDAFTTFQIKQFVFRRTASTIGDDDAPKVASMSEELYLTLYASHAGVGPPVYAATISTEGRYPQLYMMLGGGADSRSILNKSNAVDLLFECSKRASDAGLLMMDVKADNMIVVGEGDSRQVQMIDFDPRFTFQLFDINEDSDEDMASCLLYLNFMLMVSNLVCWDLDNTPGVARDLIYKLDRLEANSTSLCRLANSIYMRAISVACFSKSDCHKVDLPDPPKFYNETRASKYKKMVVTYVFMMRHYILSRSGILDGVCPHSWEYGPRAPPMMDQLKTWLHGQREMQQEPVALS